MFWSIRQKNQTELILFWKAQVWHTFVILTITTVYDIFKFTVMAKKKSTFFVTFSAWLKKPSDNKVTDRFGFLMITKRAQCDSVLHFGNFNFIVKMFICIMYQQLFKFFHMELLPFNKLIWKLLIFFGWILFLQHYTKNTLYIQILRETQIS